MKQLLQFNPGFKRSLTGITLFFLQSFAWAQDKKVDVNLNINKGNDNWYQQPWVWVVGGAVFILILVAILKGGGNKS